MSLREQLPLTDAKIVSITWYPTQEGDSNVLLVKAPLTPDLAQRLQCDAMVFDLDWNARQFEGAIGLTKQMSDCEISVPGVPVLRPDLVWKIKVSHSKTKKPNEDGSEPPALDVLIRAKFKGEDASLQKLKHHVKSSKFDMSLSSLQEELPFDGDAGGTRVEMSGDPTIDRLREIQEATPELDADEDSTDEPPASATLPSSLHMVGGTTDAAKKERKRRHAVTA